MYLFREFMNQRGRRLLKVETLGDCLGKVTNFGYNQPFYCIHYPRHRSSNSSLGKCLGTVERFKAFSFFSFFLALLLSKLVQIILAIT